MTGLLCGIAIVVSLLVMAVTVSACMLSSQISQDEERR